MYVAIKHYDIRKANDHFKWIDLEKYSDTQTILNEYDLLVSKFNDEFGISVVGVSDNANIIFKVIEEDKLTSSCAKHEIEFKVIGEDETFWIAAPKDTNPKQKLIKEGIYLDQAVGLVRSDTRRYIKDMNDMDGSILGWHQNELWILDEHLKPISSQRTIFNGSIFKEDKWSVWISVD